MWACESSQGVVPYTSPPRHWVGERDQGCAFGEAWRILFRQKRCSNFRPAGSSRQTGGPLAAAAAGGAPLG